MSPDRSKQDETGQDTREHVKTGQAAPERVRQDKRTAETRLNWARESEDRRDKTRQKNRQPRHDTTRQERSGDNRSNETNSSTEEDIKRTNV